MRILFLSRWFPYPPNNGSKIRIYNLIRGLAQHCEISLLSFGDELVLNTNKSEMNSLCQDVHIVPFKTSKNGRLHSLLGIVKTTPRSIIDSFSMDMANLIQKTISNKNFNIVIASQLGTASYRQYFESLPALFEEVEVGLLYEKFAHSVSTKQRIRNGLTWVKHRRYLAHLLQNYNACTVASEIERQLIIKRVINDRYIEVIPNCINIDDYQEIYEEPQPLSLIYIGALNYYPNYEAITWFLEKIFPLIRSQFPGIKLTITGDHKGRPLIFTDNVVMTGIVDDIRPIVSRSWVCIVPILSGGGTRLKILEAMALRTPVVSTSKGAEGLNMTHEENILIADTPSDFAFAVTRLLYDAQLRQRIIDNAYQLVREMYDWSVVMPRFLNLVQRTVQA